MVTRAVAAAEPLAPRTIPAIKPPSPAYIRMRAIGPWPGIVTAMVLIAMIVWIGVAMTGQAPHRGSPLHRVGEFCITDYECASAHCLHVRSRFGSGDDLGGRYCTETCEVDRDCPSAMQCGEVELIDVASTTTHACVRP